MKVVVLIRTDPRSSHRPCEGVRIALGLAAGDHEVDVILSGKSPLLLSQTDDMVDGEMAEKYLPSLKEYVPKFYVERETVDPADLDGTDYEIEPLGAKEVAQRLASADRSIIF